VDDEDDTREPTRERKALIFFWAKRKPFGSLLVPLGLFFDWGDVDDEEDTRERERERERERGKECSYAALMLLCRINAFMLQD
jgi:hypothetical protein